MGWSKGTEMLANQILANYNKNILTEELLNEIVKPFMGHDCDSDILFEETANDGLTVAEIICKTMNPDAYEEFYRMHTDDDIFIESNECANIFYDI